MSQSATYRYEVERRRELSFARIRATTEEFLARYRTIFDELRRGGLDEYVPDDVSRLEGSVARIAELLSIDPPAARAESQRIAADVHALPRVARESRRIAESAAVERLRQAREAQTQARADDEAAWRELLGSWTDALARELAFEELSALRPRFLAADRSQGLPADLAAELDALRTRSRERAGRVRAEQASSTRAHAQQAAVAAVLDVARAAEKDHPEIAKELGASLAIADEVPPDLLVERLVDAAERVDHAVIDEGCRREVVKGVVQALRDAGFVTEKPWRRVADERDEVVVRARRAAGNEAEFRVTLSGDLAYKFDHYEGSACKRDIGTVLPRLEEIYGVRLSSERVVWENPDDLDRTARAVPGGDEEGGHGR